MTVTLEGAIRGSESAPDSGIEPDLFVLIVPTTEDGMPLVLGKFFGSEDQARMYQLQHGPDLVVAHFRFGSELGEPARIPMDALRAQMIRETGGEGGTRAEGPPLNLDAFGA